MTGKLGQLNFVQPRLYRQTCRPRQQVFFLLTILLRNLSFTQHLPRRLCTTISLRRSPRRLELGSFGRVHGSAYAAKGEGEVSLFLTFETLSQL